MLGGQVRLRQRATASGTWTAALNESESDNATEGVIWKARDLWSAPVEWSNHEMQGRKSNESMQASLAAATTGGHSPSGGCCAFSVRQFVVVKGCAAT